MVKNNKGLHYFFYAVEHRLYIFQGTVPRKRITEKKRKKICNRKFVITHLI